MTCSHEIKRHLLLGRKVMANVESIFKSRNITLLTKVHITKLWFFPVVTLDHKEGWVLENWCFQIVVLENTLEIVLVALETCLWIVVIVQLLSHILLCDLMDCVACQALLSMGFSRQEYWSGLPFPSPGDFPDPGVQPSSPTSTGGFFTSDPPGKPLFWLLKGLVGGGVGLCVWCCLKFYITSNALWDFPAAFQMEKR